MKRRRDKFVALKTGILPEKIDSEKPDSEGHHADEGIDTYAFAVVLYEVFERIQSWNGLTAIDIEESVMKGQRPRFTRDHGGKHPMALIIEKCWAQDPADRPRMSEVEDMIRHEGEGGEKLEFS